MRKLCLLGLLCALPAVAHVSCSSVGGIQVPGERDLVYRNVLSEYFLVADAYLENKKYDKAVEFYTKAMAHPDLADSARYKIAYSYALAENWDKAIPAYRELLEKDPMNTGLEESLAYLYARQGDLPRSAATYRKLTERNPYDQKLLENFITVLVSGNYLEEAELALERLKADFPDNTTAENLEKKLAAAWAGQEGRGQSPTDAASAASQGSSSGGDADGNSPGGIGS